MTVHAAIGRSFTPVTATVEPGRLRFFLDTLGEQNPVYRGPAAAQVPPTYLFCLEMMDAAEPFAWLTELGIDLARVLHGEQGFTYHTPAAVGDVLTFRTRLADVAEKKGGAMTLFTFETAVTNGHGAAVADLSRTVVILSGAAA